MSGDHTVTTKLTKRVVDALVAGLERYLAWDIELKGFGVRVSPDGRKTYIVRYRTIGGAKRMLDAGDPWRSDDGRGARGGA